jgi:hypothetical protein
MFLQKCKECGQNVSINDSVCPHCAAPQSNSKLIIMVILVFSLGCIIGLSVSYSAKITNFLNITLPEKKAHKVDSGKPVKEDEPKTKLEKQVAMPTHKFKKTFFENAKYKYYGIFGDEIIKLTNGKYERKEKYLLVNLEAVCFGDLNGDGIEDAAVVLSERGLGGGVHFLYLFVVLNENKDPDVISNFASLHARILKSIDINSNEIVIDSLIRRLHDPDAPLTLKAVEKFKLVDNKIVRIISSFQNAQNAITALKKLQAKTEVGIRYNNYLSALKDTKYQVNLYLESYEYFEHSVINKEIPQHIIEAMKYYELAKVIWEYKFQPIDELGLKGEVEKTFKELGIIDFDSSLGELIRKNYHKAKLYGSNYRVDIVCSELWHEAASETERAAKLIK